MSPWSLMSSPTAASWSRLAPRARWRQRCRWSSPWRPSGWATARSTASTSGTRSSRTAAAPSRRCSASRAGGNLTESSPLPGISPADWRRLYDFPAAGHANLAAPPGSGSTARCRIDTRTVNLLDKLPRALDHRAASLCEPLGLRDRGERLDHTAWLPACCPTATTPSRRVRSTSSPSTAAGASAARAAGWSTTWRSSVRRSLESEPEGRAFRSSGNSRGSGPRAVA